MNTNVISREHSGRNTETLTRVSDWFQTTYSHQSFTSKSSHAYSDKSSLHLNHYNLPDTYVLHTLYFLQFNFYNLNVYAKS